MKDRPGAEDATFSAVARGGLLLTANRRLAAHLRARYDDARRREGHLTWESLEVMPLSTWVRQRWEEDWPERVLIGDEACQAVWEQVVGDSVQAGELALIGPGLASRKAREAWNLWRAWGLGDAELIAGESRETAVFRQWAAEYARRCHEHGWADESDALDRVVELLEGGALAPPGVIYLAGFDLLSPQQERLIAALRQAGAEVSEWEPGRPAGDLREVRVAVMDPREELVLAARWARGLLSKGVAGPIGIVVPELAKARQFVVRTLRDQLAPGAVLDPGALLPFNVSLGLSLADVPLVGMALTLIGVGDRPVDIVDMGRVLRSPHLAGGREEAMARARLANRLEQSGRTAVGLEGVVAAVEREPDGLTRLQALLGYWRGAAATFRRWRRPSEWGRSFSERLRKLGWPGGEVPDSEAYQAVAAWRDLLAAWSSLDAVLGSLSHEQALTRLGRMAREQSFQPQGSEAPVQVLGTLEAAGLSFSHLWLTGMSDDVWPQAPRPNPFIPFHLQRDRRLPHATAEVELDYGRRVARRLLAAAPEVVASHPRRVDDREVGPSPLICHLQAVEAESLSLPEDARYACAVCRTGMVERLQDAWAPPLGTCGVAGGGAELLADQAACPFRAFARHRLETRPLEELEPGLDRRDRGKLLHLVMEALWRRIKDSKTLQGMDDAALGKLIASVVADAGQDFFGQRPWLPQPVTEIERGLLARRVVEWMQLERERAAPFEVLEVERGVTARLGDLELRLRVDRLDRLGDGREVLIDYKSGTANAGGWFGERPDAPQLPLYAVTHGMPVAALAFASLKRGELGFVGWAEDADLLPGKKVRAFDPGKDPQRTGAKSWSDLLAQWQRVLTGLADAFSSGDARVAPKGADSCTYCGLDPLCRIHEQEERSENEDPLDG